MGFLESLRQQKEAEASVRQQREGALRTAKQSEEATRQQNEELEREFHRQRWLQSMEFARESGIGILVQQLKDIIRQDPANKEIYYFEEDELRKLKGQDPCKPIPDSQRDSVYWWDGEEHPDSKRPRNNYVRHHYINYIDVTTTPDGDVVFHAKSHNPVHVTTWRNDKDCLEAALEEAFTHPNQLIRERVIQPWHPGPLDGKTIGNG